MSNLSPQFLTSNVSLLTSPLSLYAKSTVVVRIFDKWNFENRKSEEDDG